MQWPHELTSRCDPCQSRSVPASSVLGGFFSSARSRSIRPCSDTKLTLTVDVPVALEVSYASGNRKSSKESEGVSQYFFRSGGFTCASNIGRPDCSIAKMLYVMAALIMGVFCANDVMAQSTFGTIVGTVRDPSGSVVADCAITLTNNGTSARRAALTDKEGNYVLVNLEPGIYQIEMQAPGFQTTTFKSVELQSRQTVRTDGSLSVAGQAQSVNVEAQTESVITTEVSSIAETKSGRELQELPVGIGSRALGSTSAISTLTTQAGVQTDNAGAISVAGSKPSMLSVSIDGISTMSVRSEAPIAELFPSFGTIAEIRVSEINNAAEYGGVSDITTISKGGSNQLHGGVFENLQNTDLNARNPFSAAVTKVQMNNFGGYFGGPVVIPHLYNGKDKTFFFGSYEGLRLPRQQFINQSVPSLALRSGDLSAYPGTITDLSGTPFPGNQIPLTRISPVAQAALKYLFPLPNTGAANALANNYSVNFPTPITSEQGDFRVDQNISARQTMFVRGTYKTKDVTNTPVSTGTILSGGLHQPERDFALTAAHNFVISPTLVNELRVGITDTRVITSNSGRFQRADRRNRRARPRSPGWNLHPDVHHYRFSGDQFHVQLNRKVTNKAADRQLNLDSRSAHHKDWRRHTPAVRLLQ